MGLLAQQTAPIQICFLGYPNTTGLSTIQYRITDEVADPPGLTDAYFTEKLWRLPGSAWCYQPLDAVTEVSLLPADRFGHLTFGCFHGIHKYRPTMLTAWAEILSLVPQSLLLIKSFKGLGQSETRAKFRVYFEQRGVDLNRIKFVPSSMSEQEHLQLFNHVDLALDTFPYNGTTITCEALWMGVPSITLAGPTHVSRVGASLMTHAGVPEGIAHSPEEYVRTPGPPPVLRPRESQNLHPQPRSGL
jgi:predicted O-linked N-acetylglucosamine transferase (SPINDLY family)